MKWRTKAIAAGAFLWGLAEATLFFVVPDVLITRVALDDRRKGLLACAFAVAGAVCGGALSYSFGALHPHTARQLLDAVPAINTDMIDHVDHALRVHGWAATFVGPFTGVPYKLYAAQAAATGIPIALFLLITIPARGLRFVLLALLAHGLGGWLRPRIGQRGVLAVWLLAWTVNYGLYWSLMPS